MPKVSVIVPVYGVEKYIERCAVSLFEQTLDDLEFVFVDDCTKDKSIEILESVLLRYPKRKSQTSIIHHQHNQGLPVARQTGLKYATGEYIAHCDSDDWTDINMYQLLYHKAKSEDADIVTCNYYQGDEIVRVTRYVKDFKDKNSMIAAMLTHSTPVSVWNKLIKRSLYQYDDIVYPQNNFGEDFALMIQLVHHSNLIGHVDMPLYYYYSNQSSITKQRTPESLYKNWRDMSMNTQIVLDFLKKVDEQDSFAFEINNLKEECRSMLLPIVSLPGNRDLYLNQYPELTYSLMDLFKKDRTLFAGRYWLTKLHLYSFGAKIKKIVKRK